MRGITGRHKRYVEVILDVATNGVRTPLVVVWDDQRRYVVSEVVDRLSTTSRKVNGAGMRYTIRVGNETTYLFEEGGRWFVEEKDCALP